MLNYMVIIIDILSNSPSNLAEKTPKKSWGQDSANDPVGSSDFKSGISPAKDPPIVQFGKPSISMGHGFRGYVK
jgi:hypothetical protein